MSPKRHKKKTSKQKRQLEKNPKAYGVNSAISAKRASAKAADLDQNKYHTPLLDKSSGDEPPYVVVVQGPVGVGKTTLIKGFLRHFTRQSLNSVDGPVTVVAGKSRRLTFVECPHDLNGMIDCAKFADLVLLLVDASFGFELETFEFINLLQVHGFPKVMGVLTHADGFSSIAVRNKTKKKLKTRFEKEVYKGAKLFCLSGIRNRKYLHHEVKNLARFVSLMKIRPLSWRTEHPYLLVDRFEDVTADAKLKDDVKSDRDILLYGYLRGTNFRPGSQVHISGVGDYDVDQVDGLVDPCPLPEKAPQRQLNDRERLVYAPLSDLTGFMIDKDAVYVDIPDWKVHYSKSGTEEGETVGDQMIKKLQNADQALDHELKSSDGPLFESGPAIDFEAFQHSTQETLLDQASTDEDEDTDIGELTSDAKRQRRIIPQYETVEVGGRTRQRVLFNDESEEEIGRWKEGIEERTKDKFNNDNQSFASYVYSNDCPAEGHMQSSFLLDTDSIQLKDSSRVFIPSTMGGKWIEMGENPAFRNRFSSGDWNEGRKRSEAQPEDKEEEEADFEDLELGEDFTCEDPDEITRIAQSAIHLAKHQEQESRRLEEKRMKKQDFNKRYDEGGGSQGITEETNEYKKDQQLPSFYSAVKNEMSNKVTKTHQVLDTLDPRQRILLEGFRPGCYVRMKFKGVPYEMVDCFSKNRPILVGALSSTDSKQGCLRLRLKRHRWFPKILKTRDPLVFSVGWRRFQSLPIYCSEDHNRRIRMLKYTPEHTHCLAMIWGALCPANTPFCAFQSLEGNLENWRISASGTVTEIDANIRIVKKLKLIGTPAKIEKTTSFITGMFNSPLEVARFEGASIRTVSGIRGTIKKAVKDFDGGGLGTFRASFEDRLVPSDIVFLRSWVSVEIPKYFNPVTNLLFCQNQPEKEISRSGERFDLPQQNSGTEEWFGMRTVSDIRRERNLGAPQRVDSMYTPIQRAKRQFSDLKIPTKLVQALPYALKPKPRDRKEFTEPLLAMIPEQHETKLNTLLSQLNIVHQHKMEKRKMQRARQLVQLQARQKAEARRRSLFNKEEKKERCKEQMIKKRKITKKYKKR